MPKAPASRTPPVAEGVLHALLRTWGLLRQAQDAYFARFGVSASQWGILRVLQRAERQGESVLPLKVVGERLLIQPPSVTGVVDRLERRGFVRRHASRKDLRVRHLGLTRCGRDLLTRVLHGHAERIDSLFAALQPEEQRILLRLLYRLGDHLQSLRAPSPDREPAAEPAPGKSRGAAHPRLKTDGQERRNREDSYGSTR